MGDLLVSKLNEFQQLCLTELLGTLDKFYQTVQRNETCCGKGSFSTEEVWIEIDVEPSGAKFWIYEDGAEIELGSKDGRFEWQDFPNGLNDLKDAFLKEVASRLADA